MALTLGEFHQQISDELAKDDVFDDLIPAKVRQAAWMIESNFDLLYMEQLKTVLVEPSSDNPQFIDLPQPTKNVLWLRGVDALTGEFWPIDPIDPEVPQKQTMGVATNYWRQGDAGLWLNAVPLSSYTCQLMLSVRSEWPTDLNATPPLLAVAEVVLLQHTMLLMAGPVREPSFISLYSALLRESTQALHYADEILRQSTKTAAGIEDQLRAVET